MNAGAEPADALNSEGRTPAVPAAAPEPPKPTKEARSKAMTLKLTETDYRRLKRYGFENDLTSQAIIESLVLKFLDEEGA